MLFIKWVDKQSITVMELDHIFIFTQRVEQVVSVLQTFGLSEGTANVHSEQGTACRRFFFQNAYLELAWVTNETEIKSPIIARTKLWERSQYEQTGYCPFGLCFRSTQSSNQSINLIFEDGWRYYSEYLPEGQFANVAPNEDFPAEPMLFEMPFFSLAPTAYPSEKRQPLTHQKGFNTLTKVTLTLPVPIDNLSPAMRQVLWECPVNVSWGDTYAVTLEFDDARLGTRQAFTPLLPLVLTW